MNEYIAMELKECVCMCVSVCETVYASVRVWKRCSPKGSVNFDETFYK